MEVSAARREILARLDISLDLIAERGLREYGEAVTLEVAERSAGGRIHELEPAAAVAWKKLKAAAVDEGVELLIVSAFRSVARQAEIIESKLAEGRSLEGILSVLAPPGFSEHHTGRAVDVGTPGCPPVEEEFETTPAFRWLTDRAGEFEFTLSYPRGNRFGYRYEPWHWRHR